MNHHRLFHRRIFPWPAVALLAALTLLPAATVGDARTQGHWLLREQSGPARIVTDRSTLPVPAGRYRTVDLNADPARMWAMAAGEALTLNLFDDVRFDARIERVTIDAMGTFTAMARLLGKRYAHALIVTSAGRTSAYIDVPETGKLYQLLFDEDTGRYRLFDIDRSDLEYKPPRAKPIPAGAGGGWAAQGIHAPDAPDPMNNADGDTVIDVMVVYTPAARQWAASQGGINHVIAVAMANSQLTADNSGVGIVFRLVHSAEVDYVESGSSDTDLQRLTGRTDGYMDEVHQWRDTRGADLVALFANTTGGIGWLLTSTRGSPRYAFSLTGVRQAATSYTLVHEMGHNMGLHHHAAQTFQPGPGLFDYSAGWRWTGNDNRHYCSVMTYPSGIYFDDGVTHRMVPYFSNPDILHLEVPTGHGELADNARTLREIKHVIAAYRATVPVIIGMPDDYDAGNPFTWPLLEPGRVLQYSAEDPSRAWLWSLRDWQDQIVGEEYAGDRFELEADILFGASGAGVYTIALSDRDFPGLAGATLNVRVPMRLFAGKFADSDTPDRGVYTDDQGTDLFTVLGGPQAEVYFFDPLDTEDRPVTVETCGAFADALSTNTNTFIFTPGLEEETAFRIRVMLDPEAAGRQEDVARLFEAGLDEVRSGDFTVVPASTDGGRDFPIDPGSSAGSHGSGGGCFIRTAM